ncbi:hypothetical protein KJ599_06910 [bacterium]|nr:hypothetical protein [bacterium]
MYDFYSLSQRGKRVKIFTICWYDWDESGTNREIRGTTGANDIIFSRQANKDLNDLINKKAIIRKGEKKGIYYEFI